MKKYFKLAAFFLFFFFVILGALIPTANLALKNEELRNTLLQKFASSLNGELVAAGLSITLDEKSLNISSTDLQGSLLENSLLLNIPNAEIKISFTELLRGSFFPSNVTAFSPHITFTQQSKASKQSAAQRNWSKKLNTFLKKIANNRAVFDIQDATLVLPSITLQKITVKAVPNKPAVALDVQMEILYKGTVMPVNIKGTAKNSLTTPFSYGFDIQAQSIPLSLLPGNRQFYFSGGVTDFSGRVSGSRNDVNLAGSLGITDLDMTVGWISEDGTRYQKKPYLISRAVLDFNGGLDGRKISFPKLDLQSDDFQLQGSFLLDFTSLTNPYMDIQFSSEEMEVTTLKMLLPDPLINDWTTETIFPRITNGTARVTSFKLAGTIDEISSMQQPENYKCLSWSGILQNVDTFYNDHKPLAKVHTAHLAMDGDLLTITEMEAESEQSTLRLGNVSISNLYDEKMVLNVESQGSFSLAWLMKIFKSGLTGEDMQVEVSQISSIAGQVDGDIKLIMGLTADEVVVERLSGKGTTGPVELNIKTIPLPLRLKETSFTLAFPGTCTLSGKGLMGKSVVNGTVNLMDLYRRQQLSINIEANLAELKNLLPEGAVARLAAPCITTLPGTVNLNIENNRVQVQGSLQFNRAKIRNDNALCQKTALNNQLTSVDYKVIFNKNKFDITDVTLHTEEGDIKASANGTVTKKSKPALHNINLHAASFPVKDLSILLPGQHISLLSGTLDADIKAVEISPDDLWSSSEGTFALKGWQGELIRPNLTVDNIDIQGSLNRGLFTLRGTDLRMVDFNSEYPLLITADLEKKKLWRGTVRFYGDYIDLTTAPNFFRQGKTVFSGELPVDFLKIIGRIDHVRYRNLIFSPFLIQTHITKNKIIISKSLVQQENDFIWLTGRPSGEDVFYESYFKLKDKPVNPLLALLGFENKSITGALDMEGKLTSKVTPGSTIFDTSKGSISFEVNDGTIASSSALIKILDLVSLENIFNKKDIIKWKNTLKFGVIQGKFDLLHGIFTTHSFVMDASAFDLFAEGDVDANDNSINMTVKLAPFGTLNKLFSAIPYLGFVLTGKSKSLFDYTLSVKGDIEDPEVEYIPLKGTLESLTGYLKRLVTAREKVNKEINSQLKEDLARKNSFILRMENELAPLTTGSN